MAAQPICPCGSVSPPDERGVCPDCNRPVPGHTPGPGPAPVDLLGRLARNEQGSVPPSNRLFGRGTMVGLLMMAGAAAWFVVGWMAGYLACYPPFLFMLGAGAVLRDVMGRGDS